MSSKLMLFAVLVTLTCVYGKTASNKNQELLKTEKEGRTLIEVPLIGTILMVTFKVLEFVGPLLRYKMSAFTLIANVSSWLYQNYISIIIGTVVLLGFCVITGTFALEPNNELDHRLIQAARQLEAGGLKYARMIN